MKPKAYSYIRFSSKEQEKGDSERRQSEPDEKIAERLKLPLDDTLHLKDRGLSGFTGDNLTRGALGEFIKLVDEGKIAKGSVLFMENLDRLTRLPVLEAQYLLAGILLRGIGIYTWMDNKLLNKETFNITDSILSSINLDQSNKEIVKKTERLREAWINKRNDAVSGKRKLSRGCPMWLEPVGKQVSPTKYIVTGYKPKPEVVAVIKQIFKMKLSGKGPERIANELNQIPDIWKPKKGSKENPKEPSWTTSTIVMLLINRKLIGELQPYRYTKVNGKRVNIPEGNPIPKYYPVVIDLDLYNRVQKMINDNAKNDGRGGGRGDLVNNLFGHIAYCGTCGSPMRYLNRGGELHTRQFRCANALIGLCDKTKLHYVDVEKAVLTFCKGLEVVDIIPNSKTIQSEKSILENKLQAIDGKISLIEEDMEGNLASKRIGKNEAYLRALEKSYAVLDDKLKKAKAEREEIQTRIIQLSENGSHTAEQLKSICELIDLMDKLRKHESKKQELLNLRINLRTQLRRLINSISIYPQDKNVAIFFKSGQRRLISLSTAEVVMDAYPKKIFKNK